MGTKNFLCTNPETTFGPELREGGLAFSDKETAYTSIFPKHHKPSAAMLFLYLYNVINRLLNPKNHFHLDWVLAKMQILQPHPILTIFNLQGLGLGTCMLSSQLTIVLL